jgi:Ca2+-binding RTX toxin-like protein
MALSQMELLFGLPVFDPWQTFTRILYTSETQIASPTQIVVPSEYGGKIVFTGSFTVAGGVVTGGTMTGFKVFANDTKVLVGSNYSTDAVALSAAIDQWQLFNTEPLYDLISEIPLKIVGSDDDDHIEGNDVSFKLIGRGGNDVLEGESGTGFLKGGKGNDWLVSGDGQETMSGGKGDDVFLFQLSALSPPTAIDKIKDFVAGEDLISLWPDPDQGLLPGFLLPEQFHKGTSATTDAQIIIYDKQTGRLFYDVDGTGVEAQFQFAKLKAGPKLSADSFIVQELISA